MELLEAVKIASDYLEDNNLENYYLIYPKFYSKGAILAGDVIMSDEWSLCFVGGNKDNAVTSGDAIIVIVDVASKTARMPHSD
jgi:hypothetical protein